MVKFTPNLRSLIIGIFIGVAITIASFFVYLNLLSVSIILSGVFSAITGLSIAIIITIASFFRDSFLKVYHYFKQSKIKLVVENAEFLAKGFDHSSTGYQLKVSIVNKGRKICPNLDEVSFEIKDSERNSPNLIKLTKLIGDKTEIIMQKEKMKKLNYCLVDKKDRTYDMKGLKLDDQYFMIYPFENSSPSSVGKKMNSAFSYSEYLLDLQDKEYSIDVTLKYIFENEVVPVKKIFNKKSPFAISFTTTKDPELLGFRIQTDGLKNRLSESENNLLNKEKEIENLKAVKSELLKKQEEVKTLSEEKNRFTSEISRKEKDFADQINELNLKIKKCEEDLIQKEEDLIKRPIVYKEKIVVK